MDRNLLHGKENRVEVPATQLSPADFPLGSPQSRAAARALLLAKAPRIAPATQFDEDALAIYSAMSYLDATMAPTYHDVEPTTAYIRGQELRDAVYGPIIPAHLDEHLKRYTRASGEFELAFGREPKAGDVLRYEHVALMHSSETTHVNSDALSKRGSVNCPSLRAR
jgi:hypothetical protein